MSQSFPGTIDPTDTSGTELASLLTSWAGAVNTSNAGATAPSYKAAGTVWLDTTTTTAWALKIYDGTSWITIATFNSSTHAPMGYGLKRIRTFTSSGTYTPTDANVKALMVEVQAAGGGGGGASGSSSTAAAAGGGGGAGTYAAAFITASFSSVTMTIGAGGAAGSTTPGNGGTGGTTSFGTLVSCPGGAGGNLSGTSTGVSPGGVGSATAGPTYDGAVSQVGNLPGTAGHYGLRIGGTGLSGKGADSRFGTGGELVFAAAGAANGNAGVFFGSGGSGGASGNAGGATSGGAGAPGIIKVWEYE
jgi:hypothetical protein